MTCQGVDDGSQFGAVSKAGLWWVHKGGKMLRNVRNSRGDLDTSYAPTSTTQLLLALQTNSRSLQGEMHEGKPWQLQDRLTPMDPLDSELAICLVDRCLAVMVL